MALMTRLLHHLCTPGWRLRRAFPPAVLAAIEQEIRASEVSHGAELRFAVEAALPLGALVRGTTARERAIELFSALRMWDTGERNGVLIYLLLADRKVEIVADRGVHAQAGAAHWNQACQHMQAAFRLRDFRGGALDGIRTVTHMLARHYPPRGLRVNELPDKVVLL